MSKNIHVTQPSLPQLEELIRYLREIGGTKVLTNGRPLHQKLELVLGEYLGVEHIALSTNCTSGLITALQALRIAGECIMTPSASVTTAQSLLWNGIKPVFADTDPCTLNLELSRIEAAITPQTTAIPFNELAAHVVLI